jgi:hypothetical protein
MNELKESLFSGEAGMKGTYQCPIVESKVKYSTDRRENNPGNNLLFHRTLSALICTSVKEP